MKKKNESSKSPMAEINKRLNYFQNRPGCEDIVSQLQEMKQELLLESAQGEQYTPGLVFSTSGPVKEGKDDLFEHTSKYTPKGKGSIPKNGNLSKNLPFKFKD